MISAEQGLKIDGTILRVFKSGNNILQNTLNKFTTFCNKKNVKLYCFFEQKKTNIGKIVEKAFPTVSQE